MAASHQKDQPCKSRGLELSAPPCKLQLPGRAGLQSSMNIAKDLITHAHAMKC